MQTLRVVAVLCLLLHSRSLSADVIALNFVDSGWTRVNGLHQQNNDNYFLGSDGSQETRNWFLFDLSSVTGNIVSAELRLSLPSYTSDDPSEDVGLFDVLTPPEILTAGTPSGSAQGMAVFDDLGTGVQYGLRTVTPDDAGSVLSFTLNANGVASLNAASSLWAVGGRMLTWDPDVDVEAIFGGTGSIPGSIRQLVLNTEAIPEPSSLVFAAVSGLVLTGRTLQRRRKP
ncbi:MAG TPA: hypothetical protein VM452_03605 [Caulifigura sp.]|jgi:hypothetical protein|nr:hypothetical protein [Caulifigura sp.]